MFHEFERKGHQILNDHEVKFTKRVTCLMIGPSPLFASKSEISGRAIPLMTFLPKREFPLIWMEFKGLVPWR